MPQISGSATASCWQPWPTHEPLLFTFQPQAKSTRRRRGGDDHHSGVDGSAGLRAVWGPLIGRLRTRRPRCKGWRECAIRGLAVVCSFGTQGDISTWAEWGHFYLGLTESKVPLERTMLQALFAKKSLATFSLLVYIRKCCHAEGF